MGATKIINLDPFAERDNSMTPEQKLWAASLNVKYVDAIYPFKIPDKKSSKEIPSLENQYNNYLKSKKIPDISQAQRNLTYKALHFFETSYFDGVAHYLDYGGEYIRRVFEFIQEAVTLRKKLYSRKKKIAVKRVAV